MSTTAEVERLGDAEFRWGTKRGVGGKNKEVQFYGSFSYDGVEYMLYDCVYLHKEGEAYPYIGKLIKIWQNPDKSKKVKVQWFFLPSEIWYWLKHHNLDALEKEIFLASGEGQGLANSNPLEAIAGKCNVVCTSLDSRNPQPSEEQLQMADYVFYRTFDVGSCTISDTFDAKVGELKVNSVFNRNESEMASGPILVLGQKEDGVRITIENKVKESGFQGKVEQEAKFENGPLKLEDSEGMDARPSKRVKFENGPVKLEDSDGANARNSKRAKLDSSSKNSSSIVKIAPKEMPKEKGKVDKSSNRLEDGSPSETLDGKIIKSITLDNGLSKEKHNERTSKLKNHSLLLDNGKGISEENLDKKVCKLAGNNMEKSPEASDDADEKIQGKKFEVTRRPDAGNGKWFMSLPWEERMQSAHEKRTLVLLQNLDPDYTSGEVEDIVWSAFKINCEAKVVQRTLFSSPHSGQALVIFKKREAAERVIRKLSDGCLILPNQRPLVGCMVGLPKFTGKQSTFAGHLFIDKIKLQMPKEMRDALSTSHCSQPNTIEYDLAMEWCLLQSRFAFSWKALYKQQGEDLKRLMASFKSN